MGDRIRVKRFRRPEGSAGRVESQGRQFDSSCEFVRLAGRAGGSPKSTLVRGASNRSPMPHHSPRHAILPYPTLPISVPLPSMHQSIVSPQSSIRLRRSPPTTFAPFLYCFRHLPPRNPTNSPPRNPTVLKHGTGTTSSHCPLIVLSQISPPVHGSFIVKSTPCWVWNKDLLLAAGILSN
ncbi:hypothetical protein BC834DRAFT_884907 [Gloeopeniophorella convolvens]|nr:hypothetical protein BC834DRAFT_884907 [Gloeopeniophorella convolvens]